MSAFLRFPNFKSKAFTMSYDDGTIHDKRLVKIMNEHKLAGTFNICSFGKPGNGWSLSLEEALDTYRGDNIEVAVHCARHLTLTEVSREAATRDVMANKETLESVFKRPITGMAYPCGAYNDSVVEMLGHCGIDYARTTKSTEGFAIPTDWLRMPTTCHHSNPRLDEITDRFLKTESFSYFWKNKPKLFYLWGHSFEFNSDNNWDLIERFADKIADKDDVWYATNIEIFKYVRAFNRLVFSANLEYVENPSALDVYINVLGKEIIVPAGKTVEIK